jgi:hypothetical protein
MLTIGFVKVTRGYVEKGRAETLSLFALFYHKKWFNFWGLGQSRRIKNRLLDISEGF